MHGMQQDIRYALRSMSQRPGFTAVVVLTLAAGIGSTTAMFAILYAVLLRPLPFSNPEQLVLVKTHYEPEGGDGPVSVPDFRDLRDTTRSLQSLAALRFAAERTVNYDGHPERLRETAVTANFLPILGVRPLLGRNIAPEEDKPGGNVVLISYQYWQRRFGGSPDAIGKSLSIDGDTYAVIGVMPPDFQFLDSVDLWRPMQTDRTATLPRRTHNWTLVGRLAAGTQLADAQTELATISTRLANEYPDSDRGTSLRPFPLQQYMVANYRLPLLVLMAAVTLVLLIACGNVAGLLLARGAGRRHELAVRVALGASPSRLVRQLLTEAVMLALAGGVLGLVLGLALQRGLMLLPLWSKLGTVPVGSGPWVPIFAIALSLLTAMLCGAAPALTACRTQPADDLKSGARTTYSQEGTRARALLVAGQIAISVALLISSGLLLKTLSRLHRVDPGFDSTHLLTAEIALPTAEYREPQRRSEFYESLQQDLRARPGIAGVGLINLLPVRSPMNNVGVWPADAPPSNRRDAHVAYRRWVMPGYFEAMRIGLKTGRTVQEIDQAGRTQVVVLNEELAKEIFPDRDPLGRWVVIDTMTDQPLNAQVVGIVANERIDGPAIDESPAMYVSYLQGPTLNMQIAVRGAGDQAAIADQLRAAVNKLDANVPVAGLRMMDEIIESSLGNQRFSAQLLSIFAAGAVLLAGLGLYGVLAFWVGQRTQEIGVRMALGATQARVLGVVLRRGMSLVAIGMVVGVLASLWGARLLQSLLYGVPAHDVASFGAAVLVLGAVSLAACLLPAWRASQVDPMVALRSE